MGDRSTDEKVLFVHCLIATLPGAVVMHRRSCWNDQERVKQTADCSLERRQGGKSDGDEATGRELQRGQGKGQRTLCGHAMHDSRIALHVEDCASIAATCSSSWCMKIASAFLTMVSFDHTYASQWTRLTVRTLPIYGPPCLPLSSHRCRSCRCTPEISNPRNWGGSWRFLHGS
jgi:hypothetical protein